MHTHHNTHTQNEINSKELTHNIMEVQPQSSGCALRLETQEPHAAGQV